MEGRKEGRNLRKNKEEVRAKEETKDGEGARGGGGLPEFPRYGVVPFNS